MILFVPNENAHIKGIFIHWYDNQKENAIRTKKFHQVYTLHKMDIPMTSCFLVLDLLAFCMLDLRLFTLLIHTPLCISHVIPYMYHAFNHWCGLSRKAKFWLNYMHFTMTAFCSFFGLSCPNWSQSFIFLNFFLHLFLFWCEFNQFF